MIGKLRNATQIVSLHRKLCLDFAKCRIRMLTIQPALCKSKSSSSGQKPKTINEITEEEEDDDIFTEYASLIENKQRVFIVQPEFKWGRERFTTKLSDHRLAEAKGLIEAIPGWKYRGSATESVHEHHKGTFFGSGKLKELGDRIRELNKKKGITAVFLNTSSLNVKQTQELEKEWDCRVFDRFRVVLEIFKERAHSKTAKLQVQLAELKYLRSHLTLEPNPTNQSHGKTSTISGISETPYEIDKRRIALKSDRIKKELQKVKAQRQHHREEREQKHVPQIALLGYTNAGKTTLARALSKDTKLEPVDQLFATVDSTAHRGKLPSGCNVVYIDTVGFISDLPHGLVGSFSATLDDVIHANLLIHVRDMSHPEGELQKKTVLDVLDNLDVDQKLKDNMIEVHNKIDLRPEDEIESINSDSIYQVSALHHQGLEALSQKVEKSVFEVTGRRSVTIVVDPASEQLSWLHHHTAVVSCETTDDGILHVNTIMDSTMANKYKAKFGSNVF